MQHNNEQHMAVLDQVESALKNIEEQGREVIDFETNDGYSRAKELKKPLVKMRNDGDKARLAATKFHREEQSRINELWKGIAARIESVEGPLTEGIKRIDDETKRIKAEAEAAEQKRKDGIKERIADIQAAAGNSISLDDVNAAITRYDNVTLESFEEFSEEAEQAIAVMDTALAEKKKALEAQAEEAARIETQRIEQERIAAEQKAQQDEIDRQKREIEQEKEAAARRAAIADAEQKAAAKAEREKKEALEQAEKDKAAAVEAARVQAIADEQAKQAAEAKRAEDELKERDRLAAMASDSEKLSAWFQSIPDLPEMTRSESMLQVSNRITELLGSIQSEVETASAQSKAA